MPDPNLSEAIKEAYATAPSDDVILHTLELRHATFLEPIRVVRDNADHELVLEASAPLNPNTSVLFLGYGFDIIPPSVMTSGVPELTITIDNVSSDIEEAIKIAADTTTKVEVTYRQYLLSDVSGPQNDPPLTMTLLSAGVKDMVISGKATIADIANKKFPGEDYTATRFPGLVT